MESNLTILSFMGHAFGTLSRVLHLTQGLNGFFLLKVL